MHSPTILSVVSAFGFAMAQHASTTSEDMGPAAVMWPPDRPYSAAHDNTAPCGSQDGPSGRTEFPLTNGRLALVAQADTRAVHVGVSYLDSKSASSSSMHLTNLHADPTTVDDFDMIYGPTQITDLDVGHTCIWAPNPPSNVSAGSNATFMVFYVGEADDDIYYQCSDVTYVETMAFDEQIPCFNATSNVPKVDTDGAVNVTTAAPDGSDPHPEFAHQGDGLSGGEIAGVVIGTLAGVALIAAVAFFLWRRSKKSKAANAAAGPSMQQIEKGSMSDTSSQ